MTKTASLISNVSDTALWVAYYRAKESRRPDALFKDPLAELLIGDRGEKIAHSMASASRYIEWTVIMRTVVIDALILKAVGEGVDTVINLGAGLDTRPYRMDLPRELKWIEVDHANIIDLKNERLASHVPRCRLTRVALDLADEAARKQFLKEVTAASGKTLIITEGVVLYLTELQVAGLAADLKELPAVKYWIVEYLSKESYRYLNSSARSRKLRNAPFKFFPPDWLDFFAQNGWRPSEIRYHGEEGYKRNRQMPMPRLAIIFKLLAPKSTYEKTKQMTGFMMLEKGG
jgi:methyltransferase (TIGR00027 family)